MTQPIITIFEGIDGAGKTTLINAYERQVRKHTDSVRVIHNGVYPSDVLAYRQYVSQLIRNQDVDHLIFDRYYWSEIAYGLNMRYVPPNEHLKCLLESLLSDYNALIVYCDPGIEQCLATWSNRQDQEHFKEDRRKDLINTYVTFTELYDNARIRSLTYDYTCNQGEQVNEFAKEIIRVQTL